MTTHPTHDEQIGSDQRTASIRHLTRVALGEAIAAVVRGERLDGQIHDSLRRLCAAAREHGLYAEKFVIIVKDTWRHLEEAQQLDRRNADSALGDVVRMCIQEFYEPTNA